MKNNVTISPPLFIIATSVAGGATFVTVAVAGADVLGTPPSMNLIFGATLLSFIGGAFLLAFKSWVEKQVKKFLEAPSKEELEAKHKAVMDAIGKVAADFEEFMKLHHALDKRVSEIDMRHETEDRMTRFGRNSGPIPRT